MEEKFQEISLDETPPSLPSSAQEGEQSREAAAAAAAGGSSSSSVNDENGNEIEESSTSTAGRISSDNSNMIASTPDAAERENSNGGGGGAGDGVVFRAKANGGGLEAYRLARESLVDEFHLAVSGKIISEQRVAELAFNGIPEEPTELRSLYWKLLLGYLPLVKGEWLDVLAAKRSCYEQFRRELFLDPKQLASCSAAEDHPLSTASDSKWGQFFKDKAILEEIDKDTSRTYPDMHFFSAQAKDGDPQLKVRPGHNPPGEKQLVLRQMLFIYAKLNPGIKYVQGMNELLAPIFYVFANDPTQDFRDNAEADAFWCFTNVMSIFRDHFCQVLDGSDCGIKASLARLAALLKKHDFVLHSHMEQLQINPQFYALRWITLLFSQELTMPDLMRLWDSIFASEDKLEFLLHVCTAMLINIRLELLAGDFATCLKMLQRYPPTDIRIIIDKATKLQQGQSSSSAAAAAAKGKDRRKLPQFRRQKSNE